MQILLPPKCFEHAVSLQPIEVKNRNLLSAKTYNEDIISAVNPAKPHGKLHTISSTLPEEVIETN